MLVHNMIEKIRIGGVGPPATMLMGIKEVSLGRFVFTFESWNNSPNWVVSHAAEIVMAKDGEAWSCSKVNYFFYERGFAEDPPETIIQWTWCDRSLTHIIRRAMIPSRFFVPIHGYKEEWSIAQNMNDQTLRELHPGLVFTETLHESHPLVSWQKMERSDFSGGR